MNKSKILVILLTGFAIAFTFWSCTTTPAPEQVDEEVLREPQEPQAESQEPQAEPQEAQVKPEKTQVQPKPEEPKDPPNIAFAKKLQALLDKGDVKGAIALFEKIPSELKDDLELKLVLASL